MGLDTPDIYFQSGLNIKSFNYLGKITSKNKNSKLIFCTDNIPDSNNIKLFLKNFIFKLLYKNKYEYALIPGALSKQLMINRGFKNKEIYTGIYSALQIYRTKKKYRVEKNNLFMLGNLLKEKIFKNCAKLLVLLQKIGPTGN